MKNVPVAVSSGAGTSQVISQVLGKGQVATAGRVIPVASSGATQQGVQRQAVQVSILSISFLPW